MNIEEIILSAIKDNLESKDSEIADALLKEYPEIKKDFKRETLRKKINGIRINNSLHRNPKKIPLKKIEIEEIVHKDKDNIDEKKDKKFLKQKYDVAVNHIKKLESLLDLKKTITNEKVKTIKFDSSKKENGQGVAITLFSDIHFEERVDKKSVNGLNEYNPEIAEQRCINYFKNLRKRIDKERRDIDIDYLIFASLGDMIHGFIHEEYLSTNYLTPIQASFKMYEIVLNGLNYLLDDTKLKKIKFIGKVGNHSRTTFKPYTSTEALMSNEWSIYKHLEKYFENDDRIDFILDESYFTYMTVYDKVLRFHHGHNVKYMGGVGGLTIPLIKFIYRTNQQIKADRDFIGHFHQYINFPNCVVNGSIVGFNAYGNKIGASPEEPIQQFQILDAKRGFTTNTPILTTE